MNRIILLLLWVNIIFFGYLTTNLILDNADKIMEIYNEIMEIKAKIDEMENVWTISTTPAKGIEEIEPEELKTPDGTWMPPKGE